MVIVVLAVVLVVNVLVVLAVVVVVGCVWHCKLCEKNVTYHNLFSTCLPGKGIGQQLEDVVTASKTCKPHRTENANGHHCENDVTDLPKHVHGGTPMSILTVRKKPIHVSAQSMAENRI